MQKYRLALLLCTASLTACAVGPDYKQPELPDIAAWLGAESTTTVSTTEAVETKWWETFEDAVLTQLINEAATYNHDIRIAFASMSEAKAQRRISAAEFYPSVGVNAKASREGLTQNGNSNSSERERDNYTAGLDASWEPDIFGSVSRETEASDARLDASRADYRDVMLTVFAEVSRNYFELRGVQKRIEVTEHNIELLREVEQVAQSLFESGASSKFDVALARGERESAQSALPNLESDKLAAIYRLAVLTGHPPEQYVELLKTAEPLPSPPDVVPVGLKTDILRRRPDVRRAERELAAATADIGVATADLYPRFPLTGSIGADARTFSDLFSAGGFTYLVAQAVTMPLFQGGAIRANIEGSNARAEKALAAYEKAVLGALEDAENSLVRYGNEWQTLKALQAAETTREEAYRIARLRYDSGDESFLSVIDSERTLTSTRDALILSETRMLTNLTQLYKALGGGWEAFDTPAAESN